MRADLWKLQHWFAVSDVFLLYLFRSASESQVKELDSRLKILEAERDTLKKQVDMLQTTKLEKQKVRRQNFLGICAFAD